MFSKLTGTILSGSFAVAAAALGLSFTTPSIAQPYDRPSDRYSDEYPGQVGEIIVTPDYRGERTYNGAPIERVYVSRVVDISDLDLSTGWGVRTLRSRVERAAADACDELDQQWVSGRYPIEGNDADCKARAVRRAMRQAPIGESVDTDYRGY
jgi:UrcA family protein